MGVTGSGKSTVGKLVAERLAWVFLEADEFHSPENIAKMHNGIPLTDADRLPWLNAIHARLVALHAEGKDIVLACSALKQSYRQRLAENLPVEVVYLKGSPVFIGQRLRAGTRPLEGQLPRDAIIVARNMGDAELLDYDRERMRGVSIAVKEFRYMLGPLHESLMDFPFHQDTAHRHRAGGNALGEGDHVRDHAITFGGEGMSQPSESGDHLIEHQ